MYTRWLALPLLPLTAAGAFLLFSCTKPPTPIQLKMKEIDKIFQFSLQALGQRDWQGLVGQGGQMAALIESAEVAKAEPHASDPAWQENVQAFARECRSLELNATEGVVNEILISWDGVKMTCQNCHKAFKARKK